MIYPHTSWRPNYITCAEMTAGGEDWFPKIWAAVKVNPQAKIFARDDAWWWTSEMEQYDVTRYNACTHHDIVDTGNHIYFDQVPEEWHFPQICKFGGSVPMTIQLAVQERWYREEDDPDKGPTGKFDEIYLLGCDLGHQPGKENHFHSEYAGHRPINLKTAKWRNMANTMGHELALKSSPIPIYNATPGGSLEVYPRVEFNSVIA